MSNSDYIIFEADQVLTNDHLNTTFEYLDVQNCLTRNKLIGIGIVCGLEITTTSNSISISKGCGVTSNGHLIIWPEGRELPLTQCVKYTLPDKPPYNPFLKDNKTQFEMLLMMNDEEAGETDAKKITIGPLLKDKVALLYLEANDKNLKNCDTQDCNDEGRKVELIVRPLLLNKTDVDEMINKQKEEGDGNIGNTYLGRLEMKDLQMKRFDVKATPLQDAYDIHDAYLSCFTDDVLKNIADAYAQAYNVFQPILPNHQNNPFTKLQSDLKKRLETFRSSMPIYIQYYYDFLDDLVKAYQEFRDRSFDVITECCPDEDQFPMHLLLGEATVNTADEIRARYRQYFVSSPLFNNQAELVKEVRVLFDRMVALARNLFVPVFNSRQGVPIRITPSKWSLAPLSVRSIPYYYTIGNVAKSWSPAQNRRSKSSFSLSYNADKYSSPPDAILNPLLYGLEPYDFYRIEGHIGQPFTSVLNVLLSIRNSNRLPFDVIALKAGSDASDTTVKFDCHFEDLETQLILLRAELACKMHEPLCIAAKVPSLLRFNPNTENSNFSFLNTINIVHGLALQDVVINKNKIITNFTQITRFTTKGDFLKTYCPITKSTLGAEYVDSGNKFFPRPAQIDIQTSSGARATLMHLIDITEALMQTITGASTIYNFKYDNFKRIYDSMISFFTEFMQALLNADNQQKTLSPLLYGNLEAVVTGCMDEKIKALTLEYTRRVEKVQKQNLLSEYLSAHPGIDHKAGVPRGGTFILVYHEAPPSQATITNTANTLANIKVAAADTSKITAAEAANVSDTKMNSDKSVSTTRLADTSVISKNNFSKILKLFETSDLELNTAQIDSLKKLAQQQFAVAAAKQPFNIADNTVVADFYLPYMCCSDCPPVTYVLPKVQQDILLLNLEKTSFCNNDDNTYKVTVNPLGGTLTASAGGVNSETFEFRPLGIAAGVNKLTYKLPDNREISVDVSITNAFDIRFDFEKSPNDLLTVKFIPANTENKTVTWNFGDGSGLSTEQSPSHKYTLSDNSQEFEVSLTATDGPCIITTKRSFTLTKPSQQVFTINPTLFCSNDERSYAFTAEPAITNIEEIENPAGLLFERSANGEIVFSPMKQNVQQSTTYNLMYKGVPANITIQAVFQVAFRISEVDNDPFTRKFIASNIEDRQVEWNFGDDTPVSKEASPQHTYQFANEEQTFEITLTVTDGPCKSSSQQSLTIKKQAQETFSIEPNVFCRDDKERKVFKIEPAPTSLEVIVNPNKLRIEQDANSGEIFFIPAKQDIGQTTVFKLSYSGITIEFAIVVPNANFTMDIRSQERAPTLLTLKPNDKIADNYQWTISNNFGKNEEIKDMEVVNFNLDLMRDPNNSLTPVKIVLVTNYNKSTGVKCDATKDYIITSDVLKNHNNNGEFDNSTRV